MILRLIKRILERWQKRDLTGLIAPDYHDPRDFQLSAIQEAVVLPESFDLRDKMSPIGYQNYGSCTSWAGCGVKEYWDGKEYKKIIDLSEKFNYHNIKKLSGLWSIQGDYLRNSLKAICQFGVCLEESHPDTKDSSWEEYVKKEPTENAYEEAKKYKGKTYWSVGRTLEEVRQAVFQNTCPVATGMMWYSSYNPDKTGRLPLPSGSKVGGHAISCVGWTKDKLWFRNSWGTSFGADGYFYIPFDEFVKHDLWDFWVMLDLDAPQEMLEGWVAIKYLRQMEGFKKGTKVSPICNLNLRSNPAGSKIVTLKKQQLCEIVSDERILKDNYHWQKVKVIIS